MPTKKAPAKKKPAAKKAEVKKPQENPNQIKPYVEILDSIQRLENDIKANRGDIAPFLERQRAIKEMADAYLNVAEKSAPDVRQTKIMRQRRNELNNFFK